ncbi:hypothetical protein NDU88_007638 [Pleurodeles waltl]|uniref:Uncharacterized protein n=1 Tax=Pleurodeles waltl TaxID=8319 RepID=A0AAV7VR10_PLEWA|nr:hypothetical protein NDU88_007638 [Pleurodeles waltl]
MTEMENPDIRVSTEKKREVGQRARALSVERDEEENAGGKEGRTTGDDHNTERGEDVGKVIPDIGGENPSNKRPLYSRDNPTEG